MPANHNTRSTRAIVAFDCRARTSLAVEITHYVTSANNSEFLGALIEDIELIEHSRSSLAREVLYSGTDRPLESGALTRQLRAQSKLAQTEFEQTAERLGLTHVFRAFRDRAIAGIARWAEEADSPVVTFSAESITQRVAQQAALHELLGTSIRTLLFAREGWRTGTSVLALVDDFETAAASLALGARIAESSRSPLFIKLEASVADSEVAEKLIADLAQQLSVPVQTATGSGTMDADTIAASIRQTRARIVVLPWHLASAEPDLIGRLFRATSAAVALVK